MPYRRVTVRSIILLRNLLLVITAMKGVKTAVKMNICV